MLLILTTLTSLLAWEVQLYSLDSLVPQAPPSFSM